MGWKQDESGTGGVLTLAKLEKIPIHVSSNISFLGGNPP